LRVDLALATFSVWGTHRMNTKNTAPGVRHFKYATVARGLTPHEKEVQVRIANQTYHVLVPKTAVSTKAHTFAVKIVHGAKNGKSCVIDLGGEALNSSRRIRVTHEELKRISH